MANYVRVNIKQLLIHAKYQVQIQERHIEPIEVRHREIVPLGFTTQAWLTFAVAAKYGGVHACPPSSRTKIPPKTD